MRNLFLFFPETSDLAGNSSAAEVKDKKAIEILSYSHGVSMPLSGASVSGMARTSGRTSHQDFTISKYVDQTTPFFNLYCSGGNNVKKAVIAVYQASQTGAASKPVRFMTYTLENVIITSVSMSGSGGDLPVETITLNYGNISWAFNMQDNKTNKGSADKTTSWNLFADDASAPPSAPPPAA
jgi:type VI secretion system secreted protein Hcp